MAISRNLLNEGEEVVVDTRTHVKALLAPFVVFLVTLAVAAWLDRQVDNHTAGLVVWGIALVVMVVWVLWPVLRWASASYTITDRRLITRSGVLARRGHDIPLARISDVSYELGLIDRMLGCGTLMISDASTHGQVRLHDIPNVEETQRTLNELLTHTHRTTRDNEGT